MDVLEILKNSGKDLLPEELDLLCAELDTGDYDAVYIKNCKTIISEIAKWLSPSQATNNNKKNVSEQVIISPESLVPKGFSGIPAPPSIPPEKIVASDLQRIRAEKDYKSAFKKYVKTSAIINEKFVIDHFSLFREWELSAMLACISFSENFLEKYFSLLDSKMIALYQLFSENFFIKHYSELDAETVLSKGINPWREKTQRSRQLDVFLRIKGVKI